MQRVNDVRRQQDAEQHSGSQQDPQDPGGSFGAKPAHEARSVPGLLQQRFLPEPTERARDRHDDANEDLIFGGQLRGGSSGAGVVL